MKNRLVIFDGNAVAHRAYHAFQQTRPLTLKKTGETISAVFGFAQMLLKAIGDLKPTHYAIAFDRRPNFRYELYPDYKAHRPATPDELVRQMRRIRHLVEVFHIPIFELEGYEADDIIGALSCQASQEDMETVIVTGDADTMQLVTPKVRVLYPKPRGSFSDTILYDEAAVSEKYGVKPEQITDLKGLVGDASDNIPGVKGIGDKTAVKLLQQFGSIEGIYQHIDEVTPPRVQALLRQGEELAHKSKRLATIVTELPVKLDLAACHCTQFDRNQVAELFRELEFYSLLKKLPEPQEVCAEAPSKAQPVSTEKYHTVNTAPALDELVKTLSTGKPFAFDTETTSLNQWSAQLVGISISLTPGEAYYVPVGHIGLGQEQLPIEQVISALRPPLENATLPKLAHNAKYDMTVLRENGISVQGLTFDSMIAAYLLGEKAMNLKDLAFGKLGIEMTDISQLIGMGAKQKPMSHVDIQHVSDYSCADADMTLRLVELLEKELKQQGLYSLFADVEMPLVDVLMHMERSGVLMDTSKLAEMSQRLGEKIRKLEVDIYNCCGHQFNVNSPQQLAGVLFQELHLAPEHKKRKASTGAEVLEELRGVHPVIDLILDYRQLTKLKSTYVDALAELINPKTGRVHTSFNQTKTATGRLSSTDPNLQNIPIRSDLGREIRLAFIAPEGSYLLAGDYSQIDLRALAHLSQDPALLSAFHNDADIHSATAALLFGVEQKQVTKDMRRLAKTVNFGVIYGMSEFGLEQATELSREEAGKFIASYFEKYPGVRQYLDNTKKQAQEKGYVQTLLGRRRYIAEINSPNRMIREAAERMAINMPVQGTSADIIKVAMINLYREMQRRNLKSKMLLQVHDELIFEVPEAELTTMQKLVPEIMSSAVMLNVPLKVDIKTGRNWGEME